MVTGAAATAGAFTATGALAAFGVSGARGGSATRGEVQELFLGPDNYHLVRVPPLVWNGFKGCGTGEALVCNCASIVHDPDEIERLDPFSSRIPYDWSLKHR